MMAAVLATALANSVESSPWVLLGASARLCVQVKIKMLSGRNDFVMVAMGRDFQVSLSE